MRFSGLGARVSSTFPLARRYGSFLQRFSGALSRTCPSVPVCLMGNGLGLCPPSCVAKCLRSGVAMVINRLARWRRQSLCSMHGVHLRRLNGRAQVYAGRRIIPCGPSQAIPTPASKSLPSGPSTAATGTGNNAAIGAGSRRGTKVHLVG